VPFNSIRALFASGDVGGARAILPIIERCVEEGVDAEFVDNGHISKEAPSHLLRISPKLIGSREQFEKYFLKRDIKVFIFASSLQDRIALTLARWMKAHHVPVIHVLDHWNSYQSRMETDGMPAFIPDHYAVMDSIAFEAAAEAGIDESILQITGQPALSNLAGEFAQWKTKKDRSILNREGFDPSKRLISFISEPVEHDQGATLETPGYRGYTEKDVIRRFCEILQPFAKDIQIAILPHPREEQEALAELWHAHKGALFGKVLNLNRGRDGVFMSDGVSGMGSVLLYEAWLLGKAVISIQPGLRIPSLQMLQRRQNVVFVDSYSKISELLIDWLDDVIRGLEYDVRPDLALHEKAPDNLCKLIKSYCSVQ
jgi:hypothetical protein